MQFGNVCINVRSQHIHIIELCPPHPATNLLSKMDLIVLQILSWKVQCLPILMSNNHSPSVLNTLLVKKKN
eukprot:m.71182 g.71182  ORF g.71182 m.71182 type:complete len:71 (+) comp8338_c3_seq7:6702-6914(+)